MPAASPRARRVLVVDDDSSVRMVVRAALEHAEVIEAPDGATALGLLGRVSVDIVLLDVMMPRIDGYSVLEAVRAGRFDAVVPVIMLTALAAEVDRVRAWRAGADGFVTKPFDVDDLSDRIDEVLARSGAARAAVRADELARAEMLQHLVDAGL